MQRSIDSFNFKKVWKIRKPVDIIDFGCGFGFVGLILLSISLKLQIISFNNNSF